MGGPGEHVVLFFVTPSRTDVKRHRSRTRACTPPAQAHQQMPAWMLTTPSACAVVAVWAVHRSLRASAAWGVTSSPRRCRQTTTIKMTVWRLQKYRVPSGHGRRMPKQRMSRLCGF